MTVLRNPTVVLLLLFGATLIIQLTAFLINRPTGDMVFLAGSVVLAVSSIWYCHPSSSRLLALFKTLAITGCILVINICWFWYIRFPLLNLGENFGQSMLLGFLVFLVLLPLTLLSGIVAFILPSRPASSSV